jgi:hypothetical protein
LNSSRPAQNQPTFGRYGKSFQEGLVQLIYQDRPFADQITEVLDLNFLELEYLRVFTDKITSYRDKYSKHPSANAIATILKKKNTLLALQQANWITKNTSKKSH